MREKEGREMLVQIVLILLLTALICWTMGVLLRRMAESAFLFVIIPANCYGLVTTKENESGDMDKGGGGVTDIVHNVPGKRLNKKSSDLMQWKFEKGEEPRSILFIMFGVEWIGPFRSLRMNKIRRFRYKKKAEGQQGDFGDYVVTSDDLPTKYVPYSGEQAIPVKEAETASIFQVNFVFTVIEENIFPLRSIRVADPNAYLALMIKQRINSITASRPAEELMKPTAAIAKMLTDEADKVDPDAGKHLGRQVSNITLVSTGMKQTDQELYESVSRADKEGQAKVAAAQASTREAEELAKRAAAVAKGEADAIVIKAKAEKTAQEESNSADEDRLERILERAAKDPVLAEIFRTDRMATAYEGNKIITTLVTGGGAGVIVPTK